MSNDSAAFSATLVDEWARCGLRHAIVAPGSRSTPLALALIADRRLVTHVVVDERSAGFVALGAALESGRAAVVLTTSGTATVELHAAVVEADLGHVPLLVCTADRPPELRDIGAPQTIDQLRLFGPSVRWFADLGAPDRAASSAWRSLAARAVAEAETAPAGPVQLNLPFREPLVGAAGALPPGRPAGRPWHVRVAGDGHLPASVATDLARRWCGRRGVLLAGAGVDDPDAVAGLARLLGWPVLADPRSGCRRPERWVVAHADGLLRAARFARACVPEVIVQLGAPPASKVVGQWLAASGAERVLVERTGTWWDADRLADTVVAVTPGRFCDALAAELPTTPPAQPEWAELWRRADDAAEVAIGATTAREALPGEPGIARAVAAAVPAGSLLVVSSSMPIRDVEWYSGRRQGLRTVANRGANGIDGVVSTAVGAALAAHPTPVWLLIGDLALLHDAGGLLGAAERPMRLRIVVVDNDGGGIFSFLPQAAATEAEVFERLYGTPHGRDLSALFAFHGVPARRAERHHELRDGLAWLAGHGAAAAAVVARTDRAANVAAHDRLHEAIAEAVDGCL